MKQFIEIEIKHVEDGVTPVIARGLVGEYNVFDGEYKYKGFTYGVEFPLAGCIVGDHDLVPILGYENATVGEQCRQCGKVIS